MDANTPTGRKLRIAIIGAGIGGLTCAVALKDCVNTEIDLYEAASQITEIGAGITFWPRTWKIMKAMGLWQDMVNGLKEKPTDDQKLAFSFRISDRKNGFSFHDIYTNGGATCFHRQDVQQTLLKSVPKFCQIHLSHRLTKCEEFEDAVKLYFQNGSTASYDFVVGADGIKSVVRQNLLSRNLSPGSGIFYTGTVAFRGLIPKEKLAKAHPGHRTLEDPVIYCGKSKHIVVYPISQGRIINVVAFCSKVAEEGKKVDGPDVRASTTNELLDIYSGWEDEVVSLLENIDQTSCWAIYDLHPLETYTSRRIALLGDAAHAMTPHLGAGAGQAMEDAYILGGLLSKSSGTAEETLRILEIYNIIRQPFGNRVNRSARRVGFYFDLNAPEFKDINDQAQEISPQQISALKNSITENWTWAWMDVADDLERAIGLLDKEENFA